jgi:D-tyrosyl-tRNA(Tyr) deacylase
MRVLLQRVSAASVTVDAAPVAGIGPGLLLLVGIRDGDQQDSLHWMARKIAGLRVFPDSAGLMNLSVRDTGGEVLAVSQFTLYGDTRKGNRPGFTAAARPEIALPLFENFCANLEAEIGKPVSRGVFGAHMQVALTNDGPVTLMLENPDA